MISAHIISIRVISVPFFEVCFYRYNLNMERR